MNKPELLIPAGSVEQIKRYIEAGADAVQIGEAKFGLRLPGEVTPEQLQEIMPWIRERGAKVYAVVNKIMENAGLSELSEYIAKLNRVGVDALVFGDPAVLMAVRQAAPGMPLHWNAEMTSTNYATARYWGSKGSVRMILARELNMEETLDIKAQLGGEMEIQVQVHGMTNIYHSKRDLLTNYKEHQTVQGTGSLSGTIQGIPAEGLFLIEHERPEERFPVYEDANGTHIMSSDDICMLDALEELMERGIDSFKIESLLKTTEYNETVVRSYRQAIDAYNADPGNYTFRDEWLDAIRQLQDERRELSYGFFFKEQVY